MASAIGTPSTVTGAAAPKVSTMPTSTTSEGKTWTLVKPTLPGMLPMGPRQECMAHLTAKVAAEKTS